MIREIAVNEVPDDFCCDVAEMIFCVGVNATRIKPDMRSRVIDHLQAMLDANEFDDLQIDTQLRAFLQGCTGFLIALNLPKPTAH